MEISYYLAGFLLSVSLALLLRSRHKKLPPGPPPIPIVGNMHQLPKEREWITFSKWAETYGECVHLNVLGQSIIVLNNGKTASDLLDKRSAIYSSRPRLTMAGDLVGFDKSLALMPYSPRFHAIRRLIQKELTGRALQKYWPLHEQESRMLIKRSIVNPEGLLASIRHYSRSVILKVTYGYQTETQDDPFLVLAEKVMAIFSQTSQPGAWLVDIIPWLRHVPDWVPGTGFKQTAAHGSKLHMDIAKVPLDWAKDHLDCPTMMKPNFSSTVLSRAEMGLSDQEESDLMWASASLFGGGADTTVSAISSFFLAMALHPDIQRKAQAELDRVVGQRRLPELIDRPSLPYVECIMREVMRW